MITQYRPAYYDNPRAASLAGLSTDAKPVDVENGATYEEIDTGKTFRFDKENKAWYEVPTSGGGGGTVTVNGPAITFIDYDGTVVTKWAIADLADKTELPAPPSHDGLTFHGWNWTLADIKALTQEMVVGAMYITDDGKTRIYIHLEDGRTSPVLGCCPDGTVTVDWGDGTTPDTLTGTSMVTVKWTPTHAYAAAGDYVITLQVDGTVGFVGANGVGNGSYLLRYKSGQDNRNFVYQNAIQKVELGSGVTSIDNYAFYNCYSLASIIIPDGVTRISTGAFYNCYSLASITIPDGVTSISNSAFYNCYSLASITIPSSVTSISSYAFYDCYSLASITIPSSVTSISSYAFYNCYSLASITIPSSVTSIDNYAFNNCYSLASIIIPDGVTSISTRAFNRCYSLVSITIPDGVTSIGSDAFNSCYGMKYYDFTALTAVPTLDNANAFTGIAADCEIRVPASLLDEWRAAANWSTYADYIVGV